MLGVVIGVVGNAAKVELCKSLGCDCVINKAKQDLWGTAEAFAVSSVFAYPLLRIHYWSCAAS